MPSLGQSGGDSPPDLLDLLARTPAIIYIAETGAQGRWIFVSAQLEDILGFDPAEWRARPGLWAKQIHPKDRDRVLRSEAAAQAGRPEPGTAEYRMLHRDGSIVWVRDEAALIDTPSGPRWHGVMLDVTERRQVEEELQRRAAQQAAVAMLGEHALEGANPTELMQETVAQLVDILGVDLAVVMESLPSGELEVRVGHDWPEVLGRVYRGGESSQSGYAVATGTSVIVADWESEERFLCPDALRQVGVRSGLAVPIEGGNGRFGVLTVQARTPRDFDPGDVAFVHALANVLADALARQASEDAIRHSALHDSLTGLPNRVLFVDRAEQALARMNRRGSQVAVLFLDLDHFKLVNDSMGHGLGDELLAAVALRIGSALRSVDTVARFGGDEFGVLLEDVNEREAVATAERICSAFGSPFSLGGGDQFVTTSIGIALARGGEAAGEVIRDADAAMYRSKEQGRARHELFDERMRARAMTRLRVENDLRRAMERDELSLAYQPIVSLLDDALVGVEALLRWQPTDSSPVPTREFISVAEENGMIEPIGRWVLEEACAQAVSWFHARHGGGAPPWVAVNLSAVQVVKPSFPALVADILGRTGLEPSSLYLEITETVMLRDDHALVEVMLGLKRLGVRLMLDDFGTGYSSLGYLTHLPLDALKVDRSFVDGLGTEARDTAITEAIIAMARALGLQVVGEGVETALQAAELRRIGCELAQGYWFGHPGEAEVVTRMIRRTASRLARA